MDEDNEKVVSKRMTENLRDIARETNGAYISSSPSFKDTELLYRDGIMKIESHRSNIQEDVLYNEYYFYFVLLGFLAWTPVSFSSATLISDDARRKAPFKNAMEKYFGRLSHTFLYSPNQSEWGHSRTR